MMTLTRVLGFIRWIAPASVVALGALTSGCNQVPKPATHSGARTNESAGSVPIPAPPGFVRVEPGTFLMGSPPDEPGRGEDETSHTVEIKKAFYICDHEVTNQEWEQVMKYTPSVFAGREQPVEGVNWYECIAYCNFRSALDGLDSVYVLVAPRRRPDGRVTAADSVGWRRGANGYRLPTAAEWEYACRAGSGSALCNGPLTELGCLPADSLLNEVAVYCGSGRYGTDRVRSKLPNAWGIYDMHGNVREWCWDEATGHSDSWDKQLMGRSEREGRVQRGGAWNCEARLCRCAARKVENAFLPIGMVYGFRVVRNSDL